MESRLFGPPCVCGHAFEEHDEPSDEFIGPCHALIEIDGVQCVCSCMVYFPAEH